MPDEAMGAAERLRERCTGVALHLRKLGITRTIKGEAGHAMSEAVGADDKVVRHIKNLLDAKGDYYQAVLRPIRAANSHYVALTYSYIEHGMRLLPRDRIVVLNEEIQKAKKELAEGISGLVQAWPLILDDARRQLGSSLFDERDYPTVHLLEDAFGIDLSYRDLNPPSYLADVDPALYEQVRREQEARLEASMSIIEEQLAVEVQRCIEHLIECLEPGEDGKKKIFKTSAVTNITEAIDHFRALSVTGNTQFSSYLDELHSLVSDIDAKDLRTDHMMGRRFQESIRTQMEEFSGRLEQTIVAAPRRRFKMRGGEPARAAAAE